MQAPFDASAWLSVTRSKVPRGFPALALPANRQVNGGARTAIYLLSDFRDIKVALPPGLATRLAKIR